MAVTMTATAPDPLLSSLQGPLLLLVRNKLSARAEGLRGTIPQRPDGAHARFVWWRSLNAGQARQAMLLEHLTMLVEHLGGQPAPGFDPDDVLPDAALQEAEGFDDELSGLISRYRRLRSAVRKGAGSAASVVALADGGEFAKARTRPGCAPYAR